MVVAVLMQALPSRIKIGCVNSSGTVGSSVIITGQSADSFSQRVFVVVGNVGNVAMLDVNCGIISIVGIVVVVVVFGGVGIGVIVGIVDLGVGFSVVILTDNTSEHFLGCSPNEITPCNGI